MKEDFATVTSISKLEPSITLTPEACWNLIETKSCQGDIIECDKRGSCKFDVTPVERYEWPTPIIEVGFKCESKRV